jgi:hypothetical protein
MRTTIQQLIHSFEIDRMQSTYTREQIIELLNYKLELEKQQIIEAHGDKLKKSSGVTNYEYWFTGEDYYNKKFK